VRGFKKSITSALLHLNFTLLLDGAAKTIGAIIFLTYGNDANQFGKLFRKSAKQNVALLSMSMEAKKVK
jgi:hypothetical protein